MYKAGIIGCGRIAKNLPDNHAKAYAENPDTDLMVGCDINLWNAECISTWRYGARAYTNYLGMIKREKLDIVSVCTPPETHCQIVCDIAPYVKGIYCEKPIATTLEDADKMIETCHKHNVILQINHQRRWMTPKFRFSRGILNTGTHVFDLLRTLGGEVRFIDPFNFKCILQHCRMPIQLEYIDTDEYIFEFNCTHPEELLIPKGLEHLIYCIESGKQSISSGEEGRESLRLCLEFERLLKS